MSDSWDHIVCKQAAERPEALAVSDTLGFQWTYAQLDEVIDDLVKHLSSAGVQRGDRILMLTENCAQAVAVLYACARMGAVIIPFNARQKIGEIDRIIDHAKPAAILCTSAVSDEAAEHATRLQAEPITGLFGTLELKFLESAPDALDDVAVLLYTTGTTGTPKGVMLTHNNMLFGGLTSVRLRGIRADDVVYGVLPMTHVFGLSSIIAACGLVGAYVRLEPRFQPAKLYDAIVDNVTILSAVPQMYALLMQYAKEQGFEKMPPHRLRYLSSGAAPLDPDWKRRTEAFFGMALQNGYGMTETTASSCITTNAMGNADVSVGRPVPEVEVILDQDVPAAQGDVGEVIIRGPNVMKGYYRNPEETARVLSEDGWMRSGDLGRFDDVGNLHIVGRSKELIIHGGFNVYPPEVEAALNDHPSVVQSAVIGHRVGGDELVLAFVETALNDPINENSLMGFVSERLTGYKRPSRIVFLDKLPAAPTGKILKHKLPEVIPIEVQDSLKHRARA